MATLKVANIHFDAVGTTLIRANGANTLTFNTAGTEDARIDETGNVLIGRTNSTVGQGVKLDVNGAINASSLLVNGTVLSGGGNYNMQVFTNTTPGGTTWTKPAGLKAIKVTVIGGGAGALNESGGGGGGTSIGNIPAPSIPGPVTVTVGAGGGTSAPTAGGTSSFGAFLSATGGSAPPGASVGGAGGTGSGGTLNISGGAGAERGSVTAPIGVSFPTPSMSINSPGKGGSSTYGDGGVSSAGIALAPGVARVNGVAGSGYGGAASGRSSGSFPSSTAASGTQGIVIVEEFY